MTFDRDAGSSGAGLPTDDERARMAVVTDAIAVNGRTMASLEAMQAMLIAHLVAVAQVQHERQAASGGSEHGWAFRAVAEEIAGVLGCSRQVAEARMADAVALVERYPAVFSRMQEGRVTAAQAHVVVEHGDRLEHPEQRAEYERVVLGKLDAHPMTPGRLAPVAKAVADDAQPRPLVVRHETARRRRRVGFTADDDGMGWLRAYVPTVLGAAVADRVTEIAKEIRAAAGDIDPVGVVGGGAQNAVVEGAGQVPVVPAGDSGAPDDDRSLDEVRADVFCDLLLAGTPMADPKSGPAGLGTIRGIVQITIPAKALTAAGAEADDGHGSAFLAGHGPIPVVQACEIAGAAPVWERLFVDADTGVLLTVDRRFPTGAMRRFLKARDEHCRFPGCRRPLRKRSTDADHTVDWAHGGKTDVRNLAYLCEGHHTLKHHSAWRVAQGLGGILTWTSPTGKVYTDAPPPVVRFVSDGDHDPPPF